MMGAVGAVGAVGVGDVGQSILWLALVLAAYGLLAAPASARWPHVPLLESARNAAGGVALLTTLASLLLVYAFISHDFSLRYVAQHSTRDAPLAVDLTGFWGGQAGSLLFWAWGLTLLTGGVLWREFGRARALMPAVLATMLAVQVFFLFLLTVVASPFEKLPAPAADGRGLNPLLWDDGMRIHPPLLLSGYMSFTAPFAFAIAGLTTGRMGREWLAAVRNWMLLAWTIQGAGLLAGAWWAYHVLGWGGYWGWDPVENVALLPWLTATAFLHSVMVQERRGMLKVWNVALAIASFCLAIFGTFVVRSGVLSSVHSFAQSSIGPFFFAFLGLVMLGSVSLLFYRLPLLQADAQFDGLLSREAGFLLNNLLLVGIAAATFWGTIFPLVAEAVRGVKVNVGAPFYQQVNGPLLLALLALMGLGPLLAWRRMAVTGLWRNARWPVVAAVVVSAVLCALGVRQGLALLAVAATLFAAATIGLEYWRVVQARRRTGQSFGAALVTLVSRNRRRYGGYVVHLAMVFIAFGIIGSHFYQTEVVATLAQGGSLTAGRYTLTYQRLDQRREPALTTVYADVALHDGGRSLGHLLPERRIHRNWERQPITGVALRTTWPWLEDIYVLLTGWDESGAATVRVFVNPLVSLIWLGGPIFLAGTLLSAWPAAPAPARRQQAQPAVAREREVVPGVA